MTGVCFNGMFVYVVESGTRISDPTGKGADVTVTDETVARVGRKLYCTKVTEAKLVARIEQLQASRASSEGRP